MIEETTKFEATFNPKLVIVNGGCHQEWWISYNKITINFIYFGQTLHAHHGYCNNIFYASVYKFVILKPKLAYSN